MFPPLPPSENSVYASGEVRYLHVFDRYTALQYTINIVGDKVLILYGKSVIKIAHTKENRYFRRKRIRSVTTLDLIKCL